MPYCIISFFIFKYNLVAEKTLGDTFQDNKKKIYWLSAYVKVHYWDLKSQVLPSHATQFMQSSQEKKSFILTNINLKVDMTSLTKVGELNKIE